VKDNSAGIVFTEEDGGVDWLWSVIEETVGLFINDIKEFRKRGGQTFDGEQRRLILDMPMTRNPTIVLVRLQKSYGCCSTGVCYAD
jgi:hypothetical protein